MNFRDRWNQGWARLDDTWQLSHLWQMLKELRPVRGIIVVGFLVIFFVVLNLAFSSIDRVEQLNDNIEQTMEATDSLLLLTDILNELTKLEAGVRGYVFHDKDWNTFGVAGESGISEVTLQLIDGKLQVLGANDTLPKDSVLTNFILNVQRELELLQGLTREFSEGKFTPMFRPDTSFQVSQDDSLEIIRSPQANAYRRFQDYNWESQINLIKVNHSAEKLMTRFQVRITYSGEKNSDEVAKMYTQAATVGVGISMMFLLLVVVIFHDINRSRRLQRKLEEEKERAETLALVKQRFLANMSHEIRNPLHAVIGFAEQLTHTNLTDRQQEMLRPLRRSARYLLALINDILDFSKLDSDNLTLERIGFSLPEVVQEVASTFQGQVEGKGIVLETNLDPKAPEILVGDPLRLRQMLLNLVGNAVKFTEEGRVSLQVELHHRRKNQAFLRFIVEDTGIGIPENLLEQVFAEWTQADSRTTRRYGGTGLGLAITKRLAEMHHGSIEIDSREGQGTKVILRLTLGIGTEADLESSHHPDDLGQGIWEGKRVLVADDEEYNRTLMETMLHQLGISVVTAKNGAEAWEILNREPFDLALLDLQMPEMDGFSVARKVRETQGADLPIVAVTATATKKETELSKESGMNDLLLKPFEAHDLRQMLAHIWQPGPASGDGQLSAKPEPTPETPQPVSHMSPTPTDEYSLDTLKRMVGDQPRALKTMLSLFLASAKTNTGQLEAALASRSLEDAARLAHKLAPSCRHVGMEALTADLKRIENQGEDLAKAGEWEELVRSVIQRIQAVKGKVEKDLEKLPV